MRVVVVVDAVVVVVVVDVVGKGDRWRRRRKRDVRLFCSRGQMLYGALLLCINLFLCIFYVFFMYYCYCYDDDDCTLYKSLHNSSF